MDPLFSDHMPLAIEIERPTGRGTRPFRFFNHLAQHQDFLDLVAQCWNTSNNKIGMQGIWLKLQQVKQAMKGLNTKEFPKVDEKVKQVRQQLMDLQTEMRDPMHHHSLFEQERELKLRLKKWILVEESILKQKSRVQWLKLGMPTMLTSLQA